MSCISAQVRANFADPQTSARCGPPVSPVVRIKKRNQWNEVISVKPVFSRKPYQVVYYDNGEKKIIHRRPPPLLHEMRVNDEVRITRKKNDDWDAGDTVTIAGITEKQPNTLRVVNEDGTHTFISYRDTELVSRPGGTESSESEADPIGSRYLMWP